MITWANDDLTQFPRDLPFEVISGFLGNYICIVRHYMYIFYRILQLLMFLILLVVYLVRSVSRSLSSNVRTVSSILVLDAPGFQNAASCDRTGGATFDDFGHNYLQERLQLLYHDSVFTTLQDLYCQVGYVKIIFIIIYSSSRRINTIQCTNIMHIKRRHHQIVHLE